MHVNSHLIKRKKIWHTANSAELAGEIANNLQKIKITKENVTFSSPFIGQA